jgi:MFS family permease
MMSTLIVGPFYLAGPGGLSPALVGVALAVGPGLSILTGIPSGRLVDRLGSSRVQRLGLVAMGIGAAGLTLLPPTFGVAGYVAAIAALTPGYQLVQAANGTALIQSAPDGQRGVISGLLSLSRNLGLLSGASVLGAVFAQASARTDIATGVTTTYGAAVLVIAGALALSWRTTTRSAQSLPEGTKKSSTDPMPGLTLSQDGTSKSTTSVAAVG